MTDTDIPHAVYGMARRAFIQEMDRQNMAATVDTLQYSSEPYRPGPHLKAEVLDRVTSLTHAEADLRKLLRPDLDQADFAETLARWMLYIAGASIDAEKVIKAMLKAAIPQIEADFAMKLSKEFERMIETGLLVDSVHSADELPADRQKRKTMHDGLWERAAEMAFSMIGSEQAAPTIPEVEKAFARRVHEKLLERASQIPVLRPGMQEDLQAYGEQRAWAAAAAVALEMVGIPPGGGR